MDKETYRLIGQYRDIYDLIKQGEKTKEDCMTYLLNELKLPKSSAYDYVNAIFSGEVPLLKIEDGKVSIDVWKHREAVEELALLGGENAYKIFSEPPPAQRGKDGEEVLGKVMSVESPVVKDLTKKLNAAKTRASKLKKEKEELQALHEKEMVELRASMEKELEDICLRLQKQACETVIADMDYKVLITPSIRSVPAKVLDMDLFLDNPARTLDVPMLVSKYGGTRESIYEVINDEEKKLDISGHINRVSRALFKTDIFKRRAEDESKLRAVKKEKNSDEKAEYIKRKQITGKEIYENRLKSINAVLNNPALSNQQKLAFYAGWSEYKGREVAELLEMAGDKGLEAEYVIRLLENPMEFDNLYNVRAFLLQALKSSEARIKREAVRELICGEWYVEAEYGGKPCKFQMMPVDEIIAFRKAVETLETDEAIMRAHNLVAAERVAFFEDNDPAKKLVVDDRKEKEKKSIEREEQAIQMIHQKEAESGVNVHEPVDEDVCDNDFESEVADGKE